MMQIIEIYAYFVGKNHLVVIFLWVFFPGKQIFFITIFERSRSCDSGTEFKNVSVRTFQLVSITGDIRSRADKTHVANKDIPEFRKFIKLVVSQFGTEWRYTAFAGNRYR